MHSIVVIPARYNSSRYPGKPLVHLLGKPMVIWVAERASIAVGNERVYVATDSPQIAATVHDAGYRCVMTTADALTGTDRLAEVANMVASDIYVNVQGDEPLVDPADILRIIHAKTESPSKIINGYCWMGPDEDPDNVNIPKVVTTEDDVLVYMSRKALPGSKIAANAPERFKKQVCIYAFNKEELNAFSAIGRKSVLENAEDIEILRFLELGRTVQMIETRGGTLAVDVEDDVPRVEAALRGMHERS